LAHLRLKILIYSHKLRFFAAYCMATCSRYPSQVAGLTLWFGCWRYTGLAIALHDPYGVTNSEAVRLADFLHDNQVFPVTHAQGKFPRIGTGDAFFRGGTRHTADNGTNDSADDCAAA
jgi:hypothetical protein